MKIAVLGAGGLGSFLGGALAKSGEDVSFIARGNHLLAMRDRGLTVESVSLGKFQLTVKATDKLSEIGAVDLVLFSVKSYDTATSLIEVYRVRTYAEFANANTKFTTSGSDSRLSLATTCSIDENVSNSIDSISAAFSLEGIDALEISSSA